MILRDIKPIKSNSFFVFGARGTGKSTLVQQYLSEKSVYYDLLDEEVFDRLMMMGPQIIEAVCAEKKYEWIILDEIQRLPKTLNLVHRMIEKFGQKFALTGSSSRKLKRGGANLLAGRAFVNTLFPLTSRELGQAFDLDTVLQWGSLPKILSLKTDEEKTAYLRSYYLTYIREEIQMEQAVRRLEPFREFLPVAAQCSGKILNFSKIGRAVGVQVPTVQTYFQILEDTFIGFYLPHHHRSIRKSQKESPKFYLFDNGVKKALEGSLDSKPIRGTSGYGEQFEAFVIQEIFRQNDYQKKDYRLSYFQTKNGAEIDIVLSRGKNTILIEIKSSNRIDEIEVHKLAKLREAFGSGVKAYYLSNDQHELKINDIHCRHWLRFLNHEFKLL